MALEEDNLPQRPHRKRRLRWGRLVFFIVLLAAVVTAVSYTHLTLPTIA